MANADDLIRRYQSAKSDRSTLDSHLEEIAERILPRQIGFTSEHPTKGEKRTQKIFDSRPQIALERFGAIMDSMLTPRQSVWHDLRTTDESLNNDDSVKRWFYAVNRILYDARYTPKANFAGQNSERWISLGAFGTGALYTDWAAGSGFRYRCVHLKDLYLLENHQGLVDTVFREFHFTARQAAQRWGEDALPEKVRKALEVPSRENEEFLFLHVVMPREVYDPDKADAKNMPIASYYIAVDDKVMMSEGGFMSMPYAVSRYSTAPGEVYGRGPAMTALPDTKMLNEMSKTDIRAAHLAILPPILMNDDGVLGGGAQRPNMTPGGLIMGGIDRNGRQMVQPFNSGARLDISEAKMEQRRQSIDDAFLVTLFQILVENPRMTATEALIRAQEKGMLLTPTMGRQQSEAIGPQIERELDLLMANGILPPIPEALLEAGGEYEIVYNSPMSRMQRAEELVGVQRSMELLAPFAQLRPEVLDIFNDDQLARITADVSGVPAPAIRTPEEVQEIRQQRAEAQQAQQMIESAQPVAGALKDVAQANQLLTGGGA